MKKVLFILAAAACMVACGNANDGKAAANDSDSVAVAEAPAAEPVEEAAEEAEAVEAEAEEVAEEVAE